MPNPSGKFALFVSVIRWDISRGREIVCASGQEGYRLSIFDAAGRLIRTVHKQYDPVPVTDLDIERQMKQHGIQSRDEVTIPRFLPPIWWVYADEEGRLFVSTWQRDPEFRESLSSIFSTRRDAISAIISFRVNRWFLKTASSMRSSKTKRESNPSSAIG